MHKLNKSKKHRASSAYMGLGLIAAPAVISGAILSSSYAFAGDSAVDTINLDLPISCRVAASGMDSHTAISANGTYTEDIGTTTMKITCNDNGGFSVYAAGYTGDTVGGTNSTRLVGTAVSGNATIQTGTATGPGYDGDVSNWAMRLDSDSYDYPIDILDYYYYYHAVPNLFTKVATRLAGTDVGSEAVGATLTSTYAVYVSKTQPADTYTGKVKYTLVHPNDAPAPVSLYLQNTDAIINSLPEIGDVVSAVDIRDGKEYSVGRLADGNIWLLDNLDLDLTAPGASTSITAANTNASATSLNALFNGVQDGGPDGNLAHSAVTRGYTYDGYTQPAINTEYSGKTMGEVTSMSGYAEADWMVGTYYNYCAASAGNYCYDRYTELSSDATEDICPSGWRMPSGYYDYVDGYYHYSGDYGDLYEAYDKYVGDFAASLRTPLSSSNYSPNKIGNSGYFWSSTVGHDAQDYYDGSNPYYLDLGGYYNAYEFHIGNGYLYRDSGISVRCLIDHQ